MKSSAYLRILIIAALSLLLIEAISGTEGQWALFDNPILILVWVAIILFMTAIELSVHALQRILFHSLNEEARALYLEREAKENANRYSWIHSIYKKLVGEKKAKTEAEIILDHNYDGIKELDNNLPPWWLYGFYATIIFAAVYMVRYHVFDGPTQEEEYQRELAVAEKEIEEYRKTAKGLVDASTVELLTDASDLNAGKGIFESNCVACHRADGGGGIGPNLADNYWILGGSLSNVYEVISEGGRPGKGMIAWKNDLKPLQIAQVASYIKTFQGTNPPDAKEAEGDLYEVEAPEQLDEAAEKVEQVELTDEEL
ncbi:cbb3-type cytochrome c oxidase N-terminal domain-containing protein, partial [uncultured Planktosalinus sp.]|uniref:cbb3-type cytochrome c oxidase N-terminal domain-containing protein n=1 Tax=uncultured Planktosalinus sp. TaxID=1810935 RepID=UPI0030DCDA1D